MTSSISTMLSSINKYHDLQRQSRFMAYFSRIPSCCGVDAQLLSMRCESLELPGRSFSTFDHRTYGPVVKYPYQTHFDEITLTFLCTSNLKGNYNSIPLTGMQEKAAFESWMNYINGYPATPNPKIDHAYHNFRYKSDIDMAGNSIGYAVPLQIKCYASDRKENNNYEDIPSYIMTFENCYPTRISPVQMMWSSEEVARLTVTFTYDYYRDSYYCDCAPETEKFTVNTRQTPPPLPPIGQNEQLPDGRYIGPLGLPSETPTYMPGS